MSHAVVLVAVDGPESEIPKQIEYEMAPFDEGRGDGECFQDGSRWDWYQIGGRWSNDLQGTNFIRKDQLDLVKLYTMKRNELEQCWRDSQSDTTQHREMIYGVRLNETLSDFLKRKLPKPEAAISYYAFLHNRHWHEAERLGWFGMSTATECERNNPDYPLDNSKCLHKDKSTDARIVNWQEPREIWFERFYQRFIAPLPGSKWLVVVDYHV